MSRHTISLTRLSDRRSYLWLALASVLLVFYAGRLTISLAVWLMPLFLLRFVRTQRPHTGLLLAWLVRASVAVIVPPGTLLASGIAYYGSILLYTGLAMLPYLADRLIAPRLRGFVATLVFPLAFTTLEYLSSSGPFGTITSIANTQYGDLPLVQVVSVTGIWGISFLISWFAATGNWAWEHAFAWPRVRRGGGLYAGILAMVFLGGGARLALLPPQAAPVRIAGISASQADVATLNQHLPSAILSLLLSGKATLADRALARTAFATLDADMLAHSQQEAHAGAKIVIWPEASPTGANVLQEDEPALLQQAGTLAKQEGIYLDMGLGVYLPAGGKGPFLKDESVLLDPTGQVAWTYEKTHLVPFGEQGLIIAGDGKLPQAMMRQAGQSGADLMLVSGDDWQAIDPLHTQIATFRAIENGYSLVRQTSKGLSMTVDYAGHVLSASDYFTTDRQVMVAYVPIHGVHTIYATIGDLFAWLCILGFLALSGLAFLQRGKHQPTAAVTPLLPEPQATH
jgi:apolipoprotein N-acyltransferase